MLPLREKQLEAIVRMLNLNRTPGEEDEDEESNWETVWKVLVLDSFCMDLLSPLVKVGDLLKHGVTLHMLVHGGRQALPDVPAVYFTRPTAENTKRICADVVGHLYGSFYLNFSSSLPRPLMEDLSAAAVEHDCVSLIEKVFDQFLDFTTLENNLFTLNMPNSYIGLNDPSVDEATARANAEIIVSALFSVCVILSVVPIISCPRGGAAEMVGRELDARLRDALVSKAQFFCQSTSTTSFQRPVLILLDRNVDLTVACHHAWTYQALVHDLLGMRLNKVTMTDPSGGQDAPLSLHGTKSYDLDSLHDPFWAENVGSPFPKVADEVELRISKYKEAVEEVNRSVHHDHPGATEEIIPNTQGLATAISSLPELTGQKRMIDMHTNIATALLHEIKERELDSYTSLEEDLMTRSISPDKAKAALMARLANTEKGCIEDKLRLFIIYIFSMDNVPAGDMQQFEEVLQEGGANLASLTYLKQLKSLHRTLATTTSSAQRGTGLGGLSMAVSGIVGKVKEQVRNLVTGSNTLPVTRIVEAITENRSTEDVENFYYFDPKSKYLGERPEGAAPRTKTPWREAIVFMLGGGNYVEYQNLQEYAKRSKESPKDILYGSTEICSPSTFLAQLTELGRRSST